MCISTLSSKIVDHEEEEELLEIGIVLLLSRRQNRKARKVPSPRKRNVLVRKVHLVKELSLSLGLIFEVGRLFIVQTGIFQSYSQPLPVFLQIQPPFFAFFKAVLESAFVLFH